MNNSELFEMRKDGHEGKLFYNNLIVQSKYQKKYYPPTEGETASEYARRPKIASRISQSVIDRIINILNGNTVVSFSDKQSQELYDEMVDELILPEFYRTALNNVLVTGNNLSVFRLDDKYPLLENWDGRFLNLNYGINCYEYTVVDGRIIPVLDTSIKKDEIVRVFIDDLIFGNIEHNLGFNPSVLIKSVDRYESGIYGKPFTKRFSDLELELNHMLSQILKAVKILQNVWISNRDEEDPYNPIKLLPDRINYLGKDGTLEQAVRNLSTEEERKVIEILEYQISKATQVPAELLGLRDSSKLPSGIALQILLQPLVELIERMRPFYRIAVREIAEKIVRMKYAIDGKVAPQIIEVGVNINEKIFPDDRKEMINEIVMLKREGIITEEQSKLLIEPYLKLDLLQKGV